MLRLWILLYFFLDGLSGNYSLFQLDELVIWFLRLVRNIVRSFNCDLESFLDVSFMSFWMRILVASVFMG